MVSLALLRFGIFERGHDLPHELVAFFVSYFRYERIATIVVTAENVKDNFS